MTETLQAGVHYGDFEGTAAADNADMNAIGSYLIEQGKLSVGDFIIGIGLSVGTKPMGKGVHTPSIKVLYTQASGFDQFKNDILSADKLTIKQIELELTFEEFFNLFKRFDVILVRGKLDLIGKEYDLLP